MPTTTHDQEGAPDTPFLAELFNKRIPLPDGGHTDSWINPQPEDQSEDDPDAALEQQHGIQWGDGDGEKQEMGDGGGEESASTAAANIDPDTRDKVIDILHVLLGGGEGDSPDSGIVPESGE